jgi:hypothetical protein
MMRSGRETGHARPQGWPNADYLVSVTFEVYSREYDIIVNSCIRKKTSSHLLRTTYMVTTKYSGATVEPLEACDASLRVRTMTTVTILTP